MVRTEKIEDGMYAVTDPRFKSASSLPEPPVKAPPDWLTLLFGGAAIVAAFALLASLSSKKD